MTDNEIIEEAIRLVREDVNICGKGDSPLFHIFTFYLVRVNFRVMPASCVLVGYDDVDTSGKLLWKS